MSTCKLRRLAIPLGNELRTRAWRALDLAERGCLRFGPQCRVGAGSSWGLPGGIAFPKLQKGSLPLPVEASLALCVLSHG